MAINLVKGQKLNLEKKSPEGLGEILILIVKMDTYDSTLGMCGLALFENQNDQTFSVEKIVQFYQGHSYLDKAFNWGMKWVAGRK